MVQVQVKAMLARAAKEIESKMIYRIESLSITALKWNAITIERAMNYNIYSNDIRIKLSINQYEDKLSNGSSSISNLKSKVIIVEHEILTR